MYTQCQKIKFIRINNEYVLARHIALYTVIHHSNAGINRTSGCVARAVTTSINHINLVVTVGGVA